MIASMNKWAQTMHLLIRWGTFLNCSILFEMCSVHLECYWVQRRKQRVCPIFVVILLLIARIARDFSQNEQTPSTGKPISNTENFSFDRNFCHFQMKFCLLVQNTPSISHWSNKLDFQMNHWDFAPVKSSWNDPIASFVQKSMVECRQFALGPFLRAFQSYSAIDLQHRKDHVKLNYADTDHIKIKSKQT